MIRHDSSSLHKTHEEGKMKRKGSMSAFHHIGEVLRWSSSVELPALKTWNEFVQDLTVDDLFREERSQKKQKPEMFLPRRWIEAITSSSDKLPEFPLVTIDEEACVLDALRILKEADVSSAPV
jgi:CBS domain-containing protein